MTTPDSTTTANPDGSFILTQSVAPVQTWQNGTWASLDPTLHANADGTVSPAVTTSSLVLSGGGTSPLAVMSGSGRSLSVSWPGTLPAPTLSGATATYANVLPSVDLVVTADGQGDFSHVLVVKTATAAANPALASLSLAVSTPGLTISAASAGDLTAAVGPSAVPAFTTPAPTIWDSAPAPAGTAPSGAPATSSVTGPGAGAQVAPVGVTVSGSTVTLAPSASVLTGPNTVYPAYIRVVWQKNYAGGTRQKWTQVDSAWPDQKYPKPSELQVGLCNVNLDGFCNQSFVARSFVQMSIAPQLRGAIIISSQLNFTEQWAYSCTPSPVHLWATGPINASTTWSSQPSWDSDLGGQNVAYGYPGCPAHGIGWDVTSAVAGAVSAGSGNQTFGLRAENEGSMIGWKIFANGGNNTITMSTEYNHVPNQPGSPSISAGGACQSGVPAKDVIGNDDVTFSVVPSDPDGGPVQTEFVIKNYGGSTVYDSNTAGAGGANVSPITTSGKHVSITLTRAAIQGWHSNGTTTAYPYSWFAKTTDGRNTGNPSTTCNFLYNPASPPPAHATWTGRPTIGQAITATFTAPTCSPTGNPCPVSYVYQLGVGTPVTVNSGSNWTGTIPIRHEGPSGLRVYGIASGGNPGPAYSVPLDGLPPAAPYADGDYTGDSRPDLLTVGSGAAPGLWLSAGNGTGGLGPATDIGGLGTGINPGADGPGDWAGTIATHGDFTGHHVQDVLAYYPSGIRAGAAEIIGGPGDGSVLQPFSGNVWNLPIGALQNPNTGDNPSRLVAAGNASLLGTGTADLIGISGDAANGYELDLFTSCICSGKGNPTNYSVYQTLSVTAPDGTADWNNYSLDVAQPGGIAELFALDTATGALYESTNPTQSGSALIGTGSWTQISIPWTASSVPNLVSGDVNPAGHAELWATSGGNATAYTLTGTTLSQEGTGAVVTPANDWPLTDGGAATAATDTIAGQNAALTASGATWSDDNDIGTALSLDGTAGYLTPPAGTNPPATTTPTISVWFKTSTADGVLAALQASLPSSGSTTPGGYDPVLYVGNDGKLRGEWYTGSIAPLSSATLVDDGNWHHAVLTGNATTQALYLDGRLQGSASGTIGLASVPNLDFGAGYIGGPWPAEPHLNQSGNTGYLDYFTGQIAGIDYDSSHVYTGPAPSADVVGQITGIGGVCADDTSFSTANGNPIQIYTCNGGNNQAWTLATDGTLRILGKCADITGSSTANGAKIELWSCDGAASQQWRLGAGGILVNPVSGRCLDDTGSITTNGNLLEIWDCHGGINQAWNFQPPPVSAWPLGDGSGTTAATDAIGGQNATLTGGASWSADATRGTVAAFDGATGYAATGGPVLNVAGSFTVSAWAELTGNTTAYQGIVSQDSAENSGFYLQYEGNGKWNFARIATDSSTPPGAVRAESSALAVTGTWTHLVGTYNAGSGILTLYVNGAAQGTATDSTPYNATGPLVIGRDQYKGSSTDYFTGKISNVQVFTYALTPAQIQALYTEP